MSLSVEARRSDAIDLLLLLFTNLADDPIDTRFFDSRDAAYSKIKATSWEELSSEALLIKKTDSLYFFTAKGWSEGLLRSGSGSTPGFAQRIGQLSKSLKDRVKGRNERVIASFDDVVRSCGFPAGWVFNCIDARVIARLYGRRDAGWFEGARGRLVEIPRDFGLVEVDLFADIRAENLKLTQQLAEIEELYGDYRCPTCGAPLSSRVPWEHEYGSEETIEYACGYAVGTPYGDVPCPQSPKFPQFEEFSLRLRQDGAAWVCYATTTKNVNLIPAYGDTEQGDARSVYEARERSAGLMLAHDTLLIRRWRRFGGPEPRSKNCSTSRHWRVLSRFPNRTWTESAQAVPQV